MVVPKETGYVGLTGRENWRLVALFSRFRVRSVRDNKLVGQWRVDEAKNMIRCVCMWGRGINYDKNFSSKREKLKIV